MGWMDRDMARHPPTAFVVLAVLALAGLVAVASDGTSVWAPSRGGEADRAGILATVAAICALGIVVAGAITFVLHRTILARSPAAPPWPATLLRALPATTVALALVSLLAITRVDLERRPGAGDTPASVSEGDGRRAEPFSIVGWWDTPVKAGEAQPDADGAGGPPAEPTRLPLLLLLGAVGMAVAGAVWWHTSRSRRARHDGSADDAGADAARGAVVGTIDAMLADPDPSTAIIGAYARLLEGLAACGTPRRDYEGPMEHLHRVLTVLRVRPEPLRRLIELFEVARFSTHALTSADRERALDALRDIAGDLAAGSAPLSTTAGSGPVGPPP